jgi:hypothetical protein
VIAENPLKTGKTPYRRDKMTDSNSDSLKFRWFSREINGRMTPFAGVKVTAILGNGTKIACEIDQVTGLIDLPKQASWAGIDSQAQAKALKATKVQSFVMSVFCAADEHLVVAQRQGKTNGFRRANVLRGDEHVEYSVPPCGVSYYDDAKRGFQVWTKPMNKDDSNRIDLWSVDDDGSIEHNAVFLSTLDQGETFRLVMVQLWVGTVYRRQSGTTYQLPPTADKRAVDVVEHQFGQDMLTKYVFVPGEHSEDFSSRMQILLNPEFRKLLDNLENLEIWDDQENFWVVRRTDVILKPNQAWVKFLSYGVGRGSFGILELEYPVKLGSREYMQLQFDHHSVMVDESQLDKQGLVILPPGTIVEWDDLLDMGFDNKNDRPYPALARSVTPLLFPAAIDAREVAVA